MTAEEKRIREEIVNILEGWQPFIRHPLNTIDPCLIVNQILSLVEIRAENQDLNESSHFIWPQTTQSKEEMLRYQTGEIDKEEHNKQQGQIIDEELAIYYKAQQDMLKPDSEGKHWVRVIPKGR